MLVGEQDLGKNLVVIKLKVLRLCFYNKLVSAMAPRLKERQDIAYLGRKSPAVNISKSTEFFPNFDLFWNC